MATRATGVVCEHHLTFGAFHIAGDGLLRAVDPALVAGVTQPTTQAPARLGQGLFGAKGRFDLLETDGGLVNLDLDFLVAGGGRIVVQTQFGMRHRRAHMRPLVCRPLQMGVHGSGGDAALPRGVGRDPQA